MLRPENMNLNNPRVLIEDVSQCPKGPSPLFYYQPVTLKCYATKPWIKLRIKSLKKKKQTNKPRTHTKFKGHLCPGSFHSNQEDRREKKNH